MEYVQAATGLVPSSALGVTMMHEHVLCDQRLCRSMRNKNLPWGTYMWFDNMDEMTEELHEYRKSGGDAMVEVTCHGWGRDPEGLREMSLRTGVHFIVSTGLYVEDCHPGWVESKSVDQLASWFQREITVGCNAKESDRITPVKAGVIKVSCSRQSFEGNELKCLRAAGIAQSRTGAAITSHNSASVRFEIPEGNVGMQMLEVLEDEGVSPERVIVGHVDENVDIRNLEALANKGAYVQLDTIGKQHYLLDTTRADLVKAAKNRGFLDHVLLGQDRNRKPELKKYGGPGYSDILDRFTTLLSERGLSRQEIETILVLNPARVLSTSRRG